MRHSRSDRESWYNRGNGGPLYRARDGAILGVCKGLAQYLEFPVFWMRVFWVLAAFLTSGSIVILYFIAAFLMKPEPVLPIEDVDDREFYHSYVGSKSMALHRVGKAYQSLDRRIRRMEDIVTGKDYDWERRLRE